ncbi:MAG: M13 family metallopeptidase [Thermoplasmata archaeon]|nr:M13 family metallopeptidase [Thermoplasmata archaeon]
MAPSVRPGEDFYRYAVGEWIRKNPVPADKSRWGAFEELVQYNYARIHRLLENAANSQKKASNSVAREVGEFYLSAMNTARLNHLQLMPLAADLARLDLVRSTEDFVQLIAEFHRKEIPGLFETRVYPDKKNSGFYAFYVEQGGLSLPDREYYLAASFARQRTAYERHVIRMLGLVGRTLGRARREASVILRIETKLASSSRSRTALRDEEKNYHKIPLRELYARYPATRWKRYLATRGVTNVSNVIVGQPEFLKTLDRCLGSFPLSDWKAYAEWQLVHSSAPFLHDALEREHFRFFHTVLLGQEKPEPRWKRAARAADQAIGDALGRLFVESYFPARSTTRMRELIADLRNVFRRRLNNLAWMTEATRRRALAKFQRFTAKIGHPRHFRDDSALVINRGDYLGNIRRAAEFETQRKIDRLGGPVDPDEWRMTPPMVNAYFDSTQNEIVFPAGILQPPFFDPEMDDAVNYGAIGLVIGHEITHGYDDQGRRYDERGNLRDWWTPQDAHEFRRRAARVIGQYNGFQVSPGAHVNGALTLGENIADLGGLSIAFEALQRRLAKNPDRRKKIDGLSPEQRFFVSYAQIWRETARPEDIRRLLTVDEHAPAKFRVIGAVSNATPFFEAFDIREGAPMWRSPGARVAIW